jgi:predicted GNAT family acetyltransferase
MEWRDEGFSGQLNHILVIAAADQVTQRHAIEDDYVKALTAVPVTAVPSYTLMDSDIALSRETVEAAIEGQGFDGVLVTRLLGVEEVEEYQPPVNYDHYRSYHRYYQRSLDYSSPGYYRKYKILKLETNLYDTATQELIWSMQSETIDPSAPQDVIEAQIKLTIDRLTQGGLIAAKPQ